MKDKYLDISYMWNLKKDANELIYPPKKKDTFQKIYGYQRLMGGSGGGVDWGFEIGICPLRYMV